MQIKTIKTMQKNKPETKKWTAQYLAVIFLSASLLMLLNI